MWKEMWQNHRGKLIGAASGVFLGFIYLFFGFWDMLIFAFIAFIGYYVGSKLDRGEPAFDFQPVWRWLTDKWRMFR